MWVKSQLSPHKIVALQVVVVVEVAASVAAASVPVSRCTTSWHWRKCAPAAASLCGRTGATSRPSNSSAFRPSNSTSSSSSATLRPNWFESPRGNSQISMKNEWTRDSVGRATYSFSFRISFLPFHQFYFLFTQTLIDFHTYVINFCSIFSMSFL